jgi:TPR repeat protein
MYFAAMQLVIDGKVSDGVRLRLRKAARERGGAAELMAVLGEFAANQSHVLSERELAALSRPASNGTGVGHATLAEYHANRGDAAKALDAARTAAEQGHAGSQRLVALRLLGEEGDAARARWQPLLERAAQGGDVIAMRVLAEQAQRAGKAQDAAGWLIAGVQLGDAGALLQYSHLLASGAEGLPGTVEDAVANFELVVANGGEHAPAARQALAALAVEGRGMKRNPKRAREWLLVDAERDDLDSQMGLFFLHRKVDGGLYDEAEATRWADRAMRDDSAEQAVSARSAYGTWLVGHKDAVRRMRGLALLRESLRLAKGEVVTHANNNLAWALCVSPFEDVRDPAEGLSVALRMDQAKLPPGELDTLAACHAANGDFPAAVRVQQRAIDGLPRDAAGKPTGGDGIVSRLALYKAGKAYIETDANAQ